PRRRRDRRRLLHEADLRRAPRPDPPMTPITVLEQEKILTYLEARLEPRIYDIWCRQLTFETLGENAVRVPTANPYYRDWLEKLIRKPLEDAFQNLFGRVPDIVFQVTGAAAASFPMRPAPAP